MSFGGGSGSGSIAGSTDVVLSSPTNNQILGYNTSLAKWQNQTVSGFYVAYAAAPSGGNDTPILQAAMDALAASNGGQLLLRPGSYSLRSQLKIPNKVTIKGQGRSATTLAADPTFFPINTPVVRLGDGIVGLAFASRVENLTIECSNITGSTGIYSNEIQEMSGPSFCIIAGFKLYGIHYEGNCADYEINNCEVYPASTGATYGIFLDNSLGSNLVRQSTIGVNGHVNAGIMVQNGSATVMSIHVEDCTDGVLYAGSDGAVIGVTGPTASTNITNLVRMDSSSRYVAVMGVTKNGATNAVRDDFFGKTITDSMVQLCVLGDGHMARLNHYGDKAGFFGTTAIAKPTGVPVNAAGVHAALVSLGLIGA